MAKNIRPPHTEAELLAKVTALKLWGCITEWDEVKHTSWLPMLVTMEEDARATRSLLRRTKAARLESFHPPMSDFDWGIRKGIDRMGIERCFTLDFIQKAENLIFIGDVGVGKTLIATNILRCAIAQGYTCLFTTTLDLLNSLAAQESGRALERKLKFYSSPDILVIDELGYLAGTSEQADLLFQLIARRYQRKPIIITANKPFAEWTSVFPDSGCVAAMIDRLIHQASIFSISGSSYRLQVATSNKSKKSKGRKSSKKKD